jgi:ATP-dependent RNA helicase HelY
VNEGIRQKFVSEWGRTPDRFQLEAFDALDIGLNVFVSAPTGSGKTAVADYAIATAIASGKRAIYTAPIKALSNQKFAEFSGRFGRVGLLTGDNSIDASAPIVVMTTEVLRNMIYASSSALENVATVVLDEVHFLQDAHRGPVWEEVIINLDSSVCLVCLSATVSNADQITGWIESIRGPMSCIVETTRPVELSHLYAVSSRVGDDVRIYPLTEGRSPNPAIQRFLRTQERSSQRSKTRQVFAAPSRPALITELNRRDLLPAIHFIFSRRQCDEAARAVASSGLGLVTADEQDEIRRITDAVVADYSVDDLAALGFTGFERVLGEGVGVHHAGLIPVFRELVERLFASSLLKIVYATETLAVGINMPARTVIVDSVSKFTGSAHEAISASDFAQLSGRAGRRGIDTEGFVVVPWSARTRVEQVVTLSQSRNFVLRSSFRPTSNMVVNLVARTDRDGARGMLARSLVNYQASRRGGDLWNRFERTERLLVERGFLNGWTLTERGSMLRSVFHESDILVVESVALGHFDHLDHREIAALASCLVQEDRPNAGEASAHPPTKRLVGRVKSLRAAARDIARHQRRLGLPEQRMPSSTVVAHVYEWARGDELSDVLCAADVAPGDLVRVLKQTADLLRQIAAVAADPLTQDAASRGGDALWRGVVSASARIDASW